MSETGTYEGVVATARDYYNSDDADHFYFHIWGGEDIHIGLYESREDDIAEASRRTVDAMIAASPPVGDGARVLDIGAGYGGAARRIAERTGARVAALNLSEKENERNREISSRQGLDHLVDVVDGSFEDMPYEAETFDLVWSQDSILHSGNREQVIAEVARVLKPGGTFIFTDIMQVEGVDKSSLQPVLDRIHLESLGSLSFYRRAAKEHGLEFVSFDDHSGQLPRHYTRVLETTRAREGELDGIVSREYLQRMKTGLQHWIDAGENGRLKWGMLRFQKPA